MKTVFDFTVKDRKGGLVPLKSYANEVLLIVNTATKCGFTPQYEPIENMYKKSIYPNMFDAHPPFQIDGNFGITAAIIEMLVSSCIDDDGTVILKFLPALPKCWSNGSLRGVRCRGGIKADIRWENGELVSYHISAPEHVRYRVI